MARIDFSPLFRSTVGFDQLWNMLDTALTADEASFAFPPVDIMKVGEDQYRIALAVPGYRQGDFEIVAEQNQLVIRGRGTQPEGVTWLHRGILRPNFERRFQLAEHIRVDGAEFADGVLTVNLMREVPEALRPRKIAIGSGSTPQLKTVEQAA
jgi:molecular chaperone IbpA